MTQAVTHAAKKVGLIGFRLDDFRNAVGTYMDSAGESPKTISEFLGHSSTQFTMKKYVHGIDANKRRASGVMKKILAPSIKNKICVLLVSYASIKSILLKKLKPQTLDV